MILSKTRDGRVSPAKYIIFFMACIAALFCLSPVRAISASDEEADGGRRVVRVAFPTQEGMSFIGNSGKVTGYNYDYLEKISEYTGWQMEYVLYASNDGNKAVGDAIADLRTGKVDLMGPLLKSEATEALFDFPENSYGTVYTTLCALNTSSLREQNLISQSLLRVGLWRNAEVRNAEVLAFLESENINYEIVYYEKAVEQKEALYSGEVDVISSVSLSPVTNSRIVAQFAARPYYFAAPKDSPELIAQLDATIEKINHTEPKLQDSLYDQYFLTSEEDFMLTDQQESDLNAIGRVSVLCVDGDAPYVYQKKGQPAGMLIDILNAYAQKTGLAIDYTFCDTRADAKAKLEENSYDMLIGISMTSGLCSELGFINSAPIIETPLAYVQSATGVKGGRIAIVTGMEEQIDTSGYSATIICENEQECLEAVEDGKADLAAGTRAGFGYYIYETGSTLITSLIPGQSQNICIAVSRESDVTLLSTLNNYIYSISETDLATYLSDGNLHEKTLSPVMFVRRHPVQASLIVAAVTILAAAVIFYFYIRSSRRQAEIERMHNSQLRETLQIAQEANAAKTTFLSNMSHDIRTPMNAVIGFATLLSREPGNEVKVKEYSRKITAASNHLLGLINDILDISKIESGKIALNQSVFSLGELLESINVVVRPQAGAKKQSFQIEMGEMKHELYVGDKVRINQIMINLLSNAIKYTPTGGHIEFKIDDIGSSSTSVERIRFIVSDDGYGITPEFQRVIFEPFTRSEDSMTNRETGTGLGLAITKNIIDLMGGSVTIDSAPGKGSTFTVELPLRIPHEEEDEHFWANHGVSRMLLVDDDPSICEGIKESMAGTGVIFDSVYNGRDAVDLVRREYDAGHEYSTIILDWQMPGMNGLDTAREIRKIIPIDTPVLFLTSYDWSSIETEALEIDVDGFLAKPFTVVNLMEKLIDVERFKNSVSGPTVQVDLKGMRFLAAEDNELNAEIIVELLRSEGAECDLAENGKQALDMFTQSRPRTYDAILMDVMMPVMGGYEATKAIRRSNHPEAMTIPIIAMTANAFVRDVQDALDSGMNAHIAKPISIETLKNTVASCMR